MATRDSSRFAFASRRTAIMGLAVDDRDDRFGFRIPARLLAALPVTGLIRALPLLGDAVRSEWRLAAATHNLLKLHNHQVAAAGGLRAPNAVDGPDADDPAAFVWPPRPDAPIVCPTAIQKAGVRT